jgi:dihydropteroate synthase
MNMKKASTRVKLGKKPLIMGILNVTPDSFSDGGKYIAQESIRKQIDRMIQDGADLVDVGGESSRPFSKPVPVDEELKRVIPAIEEIRKNSSIPISIDTTKAEVAEKAIQAGADIINDISALRFDPKMIEVARSYDVPVIIMHMQGTPQNMQQEPAYNDIIHEISDFFYERISWAEKRGLSKEKIIIDPGIGFGKTVSHNLTILNHLDEFTKIGCPVLIGHSRKSFIGKVLHLEVEDRDHATAIISAFCCLKNIAIVRVHDVKKTALAIHMTDAILQSP